MNVTAHVDGLNVWSESHLGRQAFRTIIEPWAIRDAMMPPAIARSPKPTAAAVLSAPAWWEMLVLSSRILVNVLAIHPRISRVASLQFRNPVLGFVFHQSDTLPITDSIPENCASALLGNKVEGGSLMVNGSISFRFTADCRSGVDLWLHLEEEYAVFTSKRLAGAISEVAAFSGSEIHFMWAA